MLGRSRGGLTTKIYLSAEGRARPLSFVLSEGQVSDSKMLAPTLDAIGVPRVGKGRPRKRPGKTRMDKDYSYPQCRQALRQRKLRVIIPERRDQREQRQKKGSRGGRPVVFIKADYAQRNVVGRCILRLKQWRRIATRYEKRAINYQAFVTLAAIMIWLR